MKQSINKFLLAAILMTGSPVQAVSWYQVEVIVFDYLSPDLDGELWFENPGLPLRDDTIELISEIPNQVDMLMAAPANFNVIEEQEVDQVDEPEHIAYRALTDEKFHLSNDYRRLELSPDYRPLLHVAWQQPGLDPDQVRAVHLEKVIVPETVNPANISDTENLFIDDTYHPPELIFDGFVRLRSTRFLHVDVDLAYFPEDFQKLLNDQKRILGSGYGSDINIEADHVRLTESRRIKLNELHYFDYPLFGVLLQVSRLEPDTDG